MKRPLLANRLLFLSVAILPSCTAQAHLQGHKLDDSQCSAAWAKASPDGNPVSYDRVEPYVSDIVGVDMEGDGAVSYEEFKLACEGQMRSPDEVAKAMELQKPPPTKTDIEYNSLRNIWNSAGPEARQRFLDYIGKTPR